MNRYSMEDFKNEGDRFLRMLPKWKELEVRQTAHDDWEAKGGKHMHKPWYNKEKIKHQHAKQAYMAHAGLLVVHHQNVGVQIGAGAKGNTVTDTKVGDNTAETVKQAVKEGVKEGVKEAIQQGPQGVAASTTVPSATDDLPTDVLGCVGELLEGMKLLPSPEDANCLFALQAGVKIQRLAIAKKVN